MAPGTSCGAGEECSGTTCVNGCYIGGQQYAAAAPNPSNACQTCQPAASTSAWTDTADGNPCSGGTCCSLVCTDLSTDPQNCGECGAACPAGPSPGCGGALCNYTLASGQGGPYGIAVDSTSVYWTNYAGGTVMKVSIGGGTPTALASGQSLPPGIAVDSTRVYWTSGGSVMMAPK